MEPHSKTQTPWRGVLAGLVAACLLCAPASAAPVHSGSLACFDAPTITQLKRDPDHAFPSLYASCSPQLRDLLGPEFADLSDSALRFVLGAVAAHSMSIYGASTVYDLRSLSTLPMLDCAGYAALAWHLARVAGADVRHAVVVGWDGSPVGNHAQLLYDEPGNDLVLDPTVGVVARASLAGVLAGHPVASERMFLFERAPTPIPLDELRDMVTRSLFLGQFGPGSLTYEQPYPPGQGGKYRLAADRLEAADELARRPPEAIEVPAPPPPPEEPPETEAVAARARTGPSSSLRRLKRHRKPRRTDRRDGHPRGTGRRGARR